MCEYDLRLSMLVQNYCVCFMVMYEYEDGLDFLGLVELFTTATNLEFLRGK